MIHIMSNENVEHGKSFNFRLSLVAAVKQALKWWALPMAMVCH